MHATPFASKARSPRSGPEVTAGLKGELAVLVRSVEQMRSDETCARNAQARARTLSPGGDQTPIGQRIFNESGLIADRPDRGHSLHAPDQHSHLALQPPFCVGCRGAITVFHLSNAGAGGRWVTPADGAGNQCLRG